MIGSGIDNEQSALRGLVACGPRSLATADVGWRGARAPTNGRPSGGCFSVRCAREVDTHAGGCDAQGERTTDGWGHTTDSSGVTRAGGSATSARSDSPRDRASTIAFVTASLLAAALLDVASPRAHAQDVTADDLLHSFARIEALECRFHEERRIALLSVPIVSDGTIHYVRPGRLARRVTSPSTQIVLVEGSSLRMSEGGRDESIDLASQPVVRSFVDSILELLAGDRAALERSYVISMETGAGGWRVTMVPRSAPLSSLLASVVFEGSGTSLARMVMTETVGDVTTTTFTDVDAARHYSPAELARVFSLR